MTENPTSPSPDQPHEPIATPESLVELKTQLQSKRKRFEEDSNRHKSHALRLQLLVIILAGCTTVLSGAGLFPDQPEDKEWFQLATLIVSALGTVLTTWLAFRNFRELWLLERQVYHAIGDILRAVELHEKLRGGKVPAEQVLIWFDSFNQILGAAGDKWAQLLSKEREQKISPHSDAPTPTAENAASVEPSDGENDGSPAKP